MSSMLPATLAQHLAAELGPMLAQAGFELVDVELDSVGGGSVVRVLVDLAHIAPGPFGRIDLEGVSSATRLIDTHLDAADPIEQAFTLEVSSPGLERPLRTPSHFARFVGSEISVKTVAATPGERRRTGILTSADAHDEGTITLTDRTGDHVIAYASIDRARTVFKWGEQIGTGETASGQPRKKGTLPKGQRPLHPKAAEAQAAAACLGALPDDDESAETLETAHPGLLTAQPEAGALASRSPQHRLATPGHHARPTEHENPEVTS